MCEQGTTLNNLTLNATDYVADTDGVLIYAIGSDVTVNNITIDYNATDGSNNAIAVYASGADNKDTAIITLNGSDSNTYKFSEYFKADGNAIISIKAVNSAGESEPLNVNVNIVIDGSSLVKDSL